MNDSDKQAVNNRLLVTLAGAIVSPWLDRRFGITLSPLDTAVLILLAYHYAAAAAKKAVAAFVLYYPPKVPNQPGPTAPKA
jgi:hypothetical protein